MSTILEVRDLVFYYGAIRALNGISFHVEQGEVVAIIGSNGAGKTTTMHVISGLLGKPTGGSIFFDGKDITTVPAHRISSMGLTQCLEGRLVFPQLSVRENLEMGAYSRSDGKKAVTDTMEYCFDLFPRLKEREKQSAGTLSGGEQQMLAVARALMSKPKVLLMDEPSLGLAPLVIQEIFTTIQKINKDGVTIVVVEQNSNAALKVCNRAYVLETGSIRLEGTSEELLGNDEVRKTYLGLSE